MYSRSSFFASSSIFYRCGKISVYGVFPDHPSGIILVYSGRYSCCRGKYRRNHPGRRYRIALLFYFLKRKRECLGHIQDRSVIAYSLIGKLVLLTISADNLLAF